MRERIENGERAIFVQVNVHHGPSSIHLSPQIRLHRVEDFYNEYRTWSPLLTPAARSAVARSSCTWSTYTAAPRDEQSSIALPAEPDWLEQRLARQCEQAIALLERLSEPAALLEELRGDDIQRELAMHFTLGSLEQGRALCARIREGLLDQRVDRQEIEEFAKRCAHRFEDATVS